MSAQARKWLFVVNNYSEDEVAALQALGHSGDIEYICIGKEVAPTTGTPHLQGYLELKRKKRRNGVKRLLGINRVHLEITRGTGEQNKKYCSKTRDEDEVPNEWFWESGEMIPNQGQRTDLESIQQMIKSGASELEIADAHFGSWVRYRASFQAYRTLCNQRLETPQFPLSTFPESWQHLAETWDRNKMLVLWGAPGIGKTHFALALLGPCLMVSHMDCLAQFDPKVHNGIIFEELDFNHYPVGSQIHLADTYFDRDIHIRYTTVMLPKGVPRIVTTNVEEGRIMNLDPSFGVRRRLEIHHLIKL